MHSQQSKPGTAGAGVEQNQMQVRSRHLVASGLVPSGGEESSQHSITLVGAVEGGWTFVDAGSLCSASRLNMRSTLKGWRNSVPDSGHGFDGQDRQEICLLSDWIHSPSCHIISLTLWWKMSGLHLPPCSWVANLMRFEKGSTNQRWNKGTSNPSGRVQDLLAEQIQIKP